MVLFGDKYPNSAAFPGQKTEVIVRMMPMLTAQGDKPGSVRLVSTVFDKLNLTLPEKKNWTEGWSQADGEISNEYV